MVFRFDIDVWFGINVLTGNMVLVCAEKKYDQYLERKKIKTLKEDLACTPVPRRLLPPTELPWHPILRPRCAPYPWGIPKEMNHGVRPISFLQTWTRDR